jgi:hypothetical protein
MIRASASWSPPAPARRRSCRCSAASSAAIPTPTSRSGCCSTARRIPTTSAIAKRNKLKYWGTVSRPKEAPNWKGDTGRVEAFFDGARLDDLEKRCDLAAGEFSPKNAVIFICGLTGTITGTIVPLMDRGFVPDFKRIREALGVPADTKDSVFYEQYDTEPVINVKDPTVVEPLKARMQAGLAKLS